MFVSIKDKEIATENDLKGHVEPLSHHNYSNPHINGSIKKGSIPRIVSVSVEVHNINTGSFRFQPFFFAIPDNRSHTEPLQFKIGSWLCSFFRP